MSLPSSPLKYYYDNTETNLLVAVVIKLLQTHLTADTNTRNILKAEKQALVELAKDAKDELEHIETSHLQLVEDYASAEESLAKSDTAQNSIIRPVEVHHNDISEFNDKLDEIEDKHMVNAACVDAKEICLRFQVKSLVNHRLK